DQYPLERFFVEGVVVPVLRCGWDEPIGRNVFAGCLEKVPVGGAVLVRTGWGRYWGSEGYMGRPYLARGAVEVVVERGAGVVGGAVELLVEGGVGVVGVDALSVDSTVRGTDHAHAVLLGNEVLIVENLARLEQLTPDRLYRFAFLPLALVGVDGSPVRAVAWC